MRTFSEREAREVFARAAAAAPPATDDGTSRLTLDELVEIGRAAGLDPERVAEAASCLGAPVASGRTLLGMPLDARRTRTLPGPLSDDAWEGTVDALRGFFGGPGTAGTVGRAREWTGPSAVAHGNPAYAVHASARPLPDGRTELRIEKGRMADYARSVVLGGGLAALATVVFAVVGAGGALGGGGVPATIIFGMLTTLFVALGAGVRVWSRGLAERFEAVLDRAEVLASAPPSTAPAAGTAMPDPSVGSRLDTDVLDADALDVESRASAPRTAGSRTRA